MQAFWSGSIMAMLALALPHPTAAAPGPVQTPISGSEPPVTTAASPSKGGFMVPNAVTLRAPTPAEVVANDVWNVRAGLNVAALQCQFSQFLATVKNYNDFIKHHSDELMRAQKTLIGHFRRNDGARASNSFEQYSTRTYNSFSTLDAQYKFCEAGGVVGREVLALGKNRLGSDALRRNAEMRAALAQQSLSPALAITYPQPIELLPILAADR